MTIDQEPHEPKTVTRRIPVHNRWKRRQVIGHTTVSSGPLPTTDELAPINPKTGKPADIQTDFLVSVDGKKS